MGYKIPDFDLNEAYVAINRSFREINSSYNTGFVGWPLKQDLYNLYFHLRKQLQNSSTFSGEEEWLEQHYKNEMWEELKK